MILPNSNPGRLLSLIMQANECAGNIYESAKSEELLDLSEQLCQHLRDAETLAERIVSNGGL